MSDMNIDSVLAQMRAIKARTGVESTNAAAATGPVDFSDTFKRALDEVNATQQKSASLSAGFVQGDPNIKLTDVMLASGHSQVAFRGLTEVRNRMVEAYREVMNMPV
ncbi:MAG: flagellar hook-basal body complex protein FliE [Salinisphaeraceae bacterium]|nr:flagellar hook-basal body complex protein FliE [Salinisphaeraceae bacterium]